MGQKRSQIDIREPDFLLWLGQFLGTWKTERYREKVQVCRRKDGFLETFPRSKVALGSVIRHGKLVLRPKSRLGPYPIELSADLMSHWLAPEVYERLKEAWRVGPGMKMIMDALEKSIAKLSQPERDQRWLEWWAANAESLPPLSKAAVASHRMLYRRYSRDLQEML